MMYIVKVKVYNEFDMKSIKYNLFVPGDSYVDVINKLIKYYGEDELEEVTMELWAPDSFLEFEDSIHDNQVFNAVRQTLEDRIIW